METNMATAAARAEQLRTAMRAWTTGVAIVTATANGERHGMTVSSFTSVSVDPPMVTVSLQSASRTHDAVVSSGAFGISILAASQQSLAERFALHGISMGDRLEGLDTETLVTGAPLIKNSLAYMDCSVRQSIASGSNTLFLAEVVAVRGDDHDEPLVYHDRTYRQLKE